MSATLAEEENDETLLRRVCGGDETAFSLLVERHTPRFHGLAWRVTLDRARTEDVLQEAFTKLWANPRAFDPGRGVLFTTWFSRVVVNLALDDWRRTRKVVPIGEALAATLSDGRKSPESALIQTQRQAQIDAAMAAIDPRQRAALVLVFCEGLPQKEAAASMGLGLKAFESLISRGKAALRDRLEKTGAIEKRRQG